jgi:hypothetical protein
MLGLVDAGLVDLELATEVVEEVMDIHLGPHRIFPDANGQEGVDPSPFESRRGWLMGHPLTWITLSWLHFGVAAATVGSTQIAIKGDDAVAVGSPETIDTYLTYLQRVGMVVNKDKTFISRRHTIFCESTYRYDLGGFVKLADYPCKALVDPSVETLATMQREVTALPRRLRQSVVRAVWRNAHRNGLIQSSLKAGVPLALPRCLGGLGLPHRHGLAGALRTGRLQASRMLTSVTSQEPMFASESYRTAWLATTSGLRGYTRDLHQIGELSASVPIDNGTLSRYVSAVQLGQSLGSLGQNPRRAQLPSLEGVGARLRRWRRKHDHCAPPHLINPYSWSWERIDGCLARLALQGMYKTYWVANATEAGITLADLY